MIGKYAVIPKGTIRAFERWDTVKRIQLPLTLDATGYYKSERKMTRLITGDRGDFWECGGVYWVFAKTDVQVVDEPLESKSKPKPLSLRQQMIPKSRWQLKQDITLTKIEVNPAHTAAYNMIYHAYMAQIQRIGGQHLPTSVLKGYQDAYSNAIKSIPHPQFIPCNVRESKSGETFTVRGKPNKSYEGYQVIIRFEGEKQDVEIAVEQLNNIVEPLEIPVETLVYLRDKTTGQYYSTHTSHGFAMVSKPSAARKFKDVGLVKTNILLCTGYFDGLDDNNSLPDWMGDTTKQWDLPATWEAVKFNKRTKEELETIEIQDWYARTWQLRALTVKYGSSVRKVFSTLEKGGKINDFKGLLVFQVPPETVTYVGPNNQQYSYQEQDEISPERLQDIREAIDQSSVTKKDLVRAQDFKSVSVAFRTSAIATMVKLSYSGDLKPYVINLEDMKEVVG